MRLLTCLLVLILASAVTTARAQDSTDIESGEDIVALASSREDLSTLVSAIEAAGLAEALSGEGPFTFFAPTNEAFGRLPEDTLDELLKPENANRLSAILTYHVLLQEETAADIASMTEALTMLGVPISISAEGDAVMVNEATIVETDIVASNGIVYVIDTVLLPPEQEEAASLPPWPPPKASARDELPDSFFRSLDESITLDAVAQLLEKAVKEAGFPQWRYSPILGDQNRVEGFVLTLTMEKADANWNPASDRWMENVQPIELRDLFTASGRALFWKALLTDNKGYYRIILLAVSDKQLSDSDLETSAPTRLEAREWLDGMLSLPDSIGNMKYTNQHRVSTFVYEFEKPQYGDPAFIKTTTVGGLFHLQSSGIWAALKDE